MIDKLKAIGTTGLGAAFMLGLFALSFVALLLFIKGAVWVSENLLGWLFAAGWIVVTLDVLILLPLSLARRLRPHTGGLIYLSSYLFGVITWLYGFIVTYTLWGAVGIVIGMMFMGIGVVFIGILASLFNALWLPFFTLVVLAVLTYGSRLIGYAIGNLSPAIEGADIAI